MYGSYTTDQYNNMRQCSSRACYKHALEIELKRQPEATVIDVGMGELAVFSEMAIELNARRIVGIEVTPHAFHSACRYLEKRTNCPMRAIADGVVTISDRITLLCGDVLDTDVAQFVPRDKPALIVHELIGTFADEEELCCVIGSLKRQLHEHKIVRTIPQTVRTMMHPLSTCRQPVIGYYLNYDRSVISSRYQVRCGRCKSYTLEKIDLLAPLPTVETFECKTPIDVKCLIIDIAIDFGHGIVHRSNSKDAWRQVVVPCAHLRFDRVVLLKNAFSDYSLHMGDHKVNIKGEEDVFRDEQRINISTHQPLRRTSEES